MLIKEYRIALPMSVDEYRIAQLYMIQKKSREESHGAGSGVEILVNEPYQNGPGGSGQYTYKIYHIGSHLPGWFRSILPKSALRVEEEAWNAYPYTKTRYKCPFVEKFFLEIETRYQNDGGEQDNIFNLTDVDKQQRQIDFIDIVKDSVPSSEYKKEEDPKLYCSLKTERGPLSENWREEYAKACKNGPCNGQAIMTAYKLCKVEFRYWGMQTKIEKFIHDIGLRKTMLRAHRQAWCWQDEYYGLTLEDIRHLERETQAALAEKMASANEDVEPIENKKLIIPPSSSVIAGEDKTSPISSSHSGDPLHSSVISRTSPCPSVPDHLSNLENLTSSRSFGSKKSVTESSRNLSDWRLESLEQLQESSSEDEQFYDALERWDSLSLNGERPRLMHSTSVELISSTDEFKEDSRDKGTSFERKLEKYTAKSVDAAAYSSLNISSNNRSDVLFMVLYGGCLLETGQEFPSIRGDYATFKNTFDTVINAHYPSALNHVFFRLIHCPSSCAESLNILSGLSPYSSDSLGVKDGDPNLTLTQEFIPLGAIALFASSSSDFDEHVSVVVSKANHVYQEFLRSDEGQGFTGQVCFIADSAGSLLAYEALCLSNTKDQRNSSRYGSHGSVYDAEGVENNTVGAGSHHQQQSNPDLTSIPQDNGMSSPVSNDVFTHEIEGHKTPEVSRKASTNQHLSVHGISGNCGGSHVSQRNSSGSHYDSSHVARLSFEVSDFFMFGAPLGLILAYKRSFPPVRPACHQLYNLFHSHDPSAVRLEPLIHDGFKHISPIKVPRYSKFPLGYGETVHVVETIHCNLRLFTNSRRRSASPCQPSLQRQSSCTSLCSQASCLDELTVSSITNVTNRWWGNKRLDYVLYCPEVLHSFPTNALPQLFHSSFWESSDVVSFILRQVFRQESLSSNTEAEINRGTSRKFSPSKPCEKWLKRRTTIKVRNLQPNHRANDVIVIEDSQQILTGKFTYGPFDMTYLSGEKVDIYIMKSPPSGEWDYLGNEMTDNHGKVSFTIPEEKRVTQGIYPVKMVVRGDHTSTDFFLSVLPPKTETVVFSIDGSFTASMSIMGKDPKVRAGAVDVVRYWQNLGYFILYVTARPDMQHKKVISWLAQHNFPHGMVGFMDGISKDPLRQKLNFLKNYQTEAQLVYKAVYGSAKDISIYRELDIPKQQIYIVGRVSKRQHGLAQILSEGYASHLTDLMKPGTSRSAVGNARLFIRKSCFSLPEQPVRKKSAKRSASCPHRSSSTFEASADRSSMDLSGQAAFGSQPRLRGSSPRTKMPMCLYQDEI